MTATIVPTGEERLERLYKRLKKNYPKMDIRFVNESLIFEKFRLVKYKVVLYETFDGESLQICDAIWGSGSYGFERNLLEFYYHDDPIGNITELKAYNLFVKAMKNEGLITEGERTT